MNSFVFQEKDHCNPRLQPKTAFSRFQPVPRADLEGQQRVDIVEKLAN
jgi:hypothetical protein